MNHILPLFAVLLTTSTQANAQRTLTAPYTCTITTTQTCDEGDGETVQNSDLRITERTTAGAEEILDMRNRIDQLEAQNPMMKLLRNNQPINHPLGPLGVLPTKCSEIVKTPNVDLERVVVYPLRSYSEVLPYIINCTDGGWITIQRKFNTTSTFDRPWVEYVPGFGNPDGEFWLGLRHLHLLTLTPHELRIDLTFDDGSVKYALYKIFYVGPEIEHFRLVIGHYIGNAGDHMKWNNHKQFTTNDRDLDSTWYNCAESQGGGWWYTDCGYSSLNGDYDEGEFYWGEKELAKSEMKIRPMC